MDNLLHKPHLVIVDKGTKMPKNLTTWFMDDPLSKADVCMIVIFDNV